MFDQELPYDVDGVVVPLLQECCRLGIDGLSDADLLSEEVLQDFVSNQQTDLWRDASNGGVEALIELRARLGLPAFR